MKRIRFLLVCMLLLVTFTGCGDKKINTNDPAINTEQTEKTKEENEKHVNKNHVLSEKDIESAKKVAMDYYEGTVFEVNSMSYIEPGTNENAEGECNFMVNVSKDGEVQNPDRMIQLNRKGETWEIVSEGF